MSAGEWVSEHWLRDVLLHAEFVAVVVPDAVRVAQQRFDDLAATSADMLARHGRCPDALVWGTTQRGWLFLGGFLATGGQLHYRGMLSLPGDDRAPGEELPPSVRARRDEALQAMARVRESSGAEHLVGRGPRMRGGPSWAWRDSALVFDCGAEDGLPGWWTLPQQLGCVPAEAVFAGEVAQLLMSPG